MCVCMCVCQKVVCVCMWCVIGMCYCVCSVCSVCSVYCVLIVNGYGTRRTWLLCGWTLTWWRSLMWIVDVEELWLNGTGCDLGTVRRYIKFTLWVYVWVCEAGVFLWILSFLQRRRGLRYFHVCIVPTMSIVAAAISSTYLIHTYFHQSITKY